MTVFYFMTGSVSKPPLEMHDITADIGIRSFNTETAENTLNESPIVIQSREQALV